MLPKEAFRTSISIPDGTCPGITPWQPCLIHPAIIGSPGWARTSDILINSQTLYQLSYWETLGKLQVLSFSLSFDVRRRDSNPLLQVMSLASYLDYPLRV